MAKKVTKEIVKEPTPKTFTESDIINKDFKSDDNEVLNLKVTQELLVVKDPMEDLNISDFKIKDPLFIEGPTVTNNFETYPNDELVNAVKVLLGNLDGIYIGGQAQSSKQALEQIINNQ